VDSFSEIPPGKLQEDVLKGCHPHDAALTAIVVSDLLEEFSPVLGIDKKTMSEILKSEVMGVDKGPEVLTRVIDFNDVAAHMFTDQFPGFALNEDQTMIDDDEPVTQLRGFLHIMGGQKNGNALFTESLKPVPELMP
jgi:hypothetical protein